MSARIRIFRTADWPALAAGIVQRRIDARRREHAKCSVMLTGGRSAQSLYRAWAAIPGFQRMTDVTFYFGDERCVAADHSESNYGMVCRTLFGGDLPAGCSIFRMEADDPDREAAARRYSRILPDSLDVLLLGVGEDGHVASLFPGSSSLRETGRCVVPVTGPKPPWERLTITPQVIAKAKSIFVLANGVAKAKVLKRAMLAPTDIDSLPARLALNATWLLDAALPESISHE